MSPSSIVAVLVTCIVLAPDLAHAAECSCEHLPVLQAELRNAQRLQNAFRNEIAALRAMGAGASQGALQKFARGAARSGLEPVPGSTGPREVDYVPRGDNVHRDGIDSFTTDQLCRMADSAAEELSQAVRGSACDGIGEALRAHESVHGSFCRRIGYRAYSDVHDADRAQEEVEAYAAQIAALRAVIARVLERATVRIETRVTTRAQFSRNPLYSAIRVENRGEVRASRAALNGETIRMDGQGSQTTNAAIEGNCTITGGLPATLATRGGIDTDGLTARIRYEVGGTFPSTGMHCRIPGQGAGGGISMPVPLPMNQVGNAPVDPVLPLRDGAEIVIDMATSQAAQIMRQGNVQLTGEGRMRLALQCPAR